MMNLTDSQLELQRAAELFAKESLGSNLEERDREGTFDHEGWRMCADFGVVVLTLLSGWGCARGPAAIHVDPSERHQVVSGWETTAEIGLEVIRSAALRDSLVALAVDEIGVNRLRLAIRAGSEGPIDHFSRLRSGEIDVEQWRCVRYATVNDNSDPDSIDGSGFHFTELDEAVEEVALPMARRLAERGERLHVNLNYTAFTRQTCGDQAYIHAEEPEEYAEFALAAFLHLRGKYGLEPDTWEMILEPDLSGAWSGEQLGRALVAAARRLGEAGFQPRFAAPSASSTSATIRYLDEMARVPGALELLDEIPYHRYGLSRSDDIRTIAARARGLSIDAAMLEKMDAGVEELHEDLTVGNVIAWQQFVLAYPTEDNGAQLITYRTSEDRASDIQIGDKARLLTQYFRYVRAGAQRVGAVSSSARHEPVAFENADGTFVVVIRARRGGDVRVTGLPAGRYGVTYTSGSEFLVDAGEHSVAEDGVLALRLPEGVGTLFSLAPGAER
ncbi:MAG: hypothetical protein WEB90_04570 [Gemmatimonadota bacterium]